MSAAVSISLRTAASLLFDSLRAVVRERHILKGAGVRVTTVAGQELFPLRQSVSTPIPSSPPSCGNANNASPRWRRQDAADMDGDTQPAVMPPPPAGLLEAVGSDVISVSPGGVAYIEHLGRELAGSDAVMSGGGGVVDRTGTISQGGEHGGGSGHHQQQHEAVASLWRLRAARRRRQARGDKMRSLVTWAAGEDPSTTWKAARASSTALDGVDGGGRRGARGGGDTVDLLVRGKGEAGRSGGLGLDGTVGRTVPRAASASSRAGEMGKEEPGAEQGSALGWGVKFQARALAIPASFLPKRFESL